jgi:hypothetical protein
METGIFSYKTNHVRSLVTPLTRINLQYKRGLRTELFVLLRTALVSKFHTYLKRISTLNYKKKLRESVSQFGEYKFCNDIQED